MISNHSSCVLFALALCFSFYVIPLTVDAQQRGHLMSRACPFSCRSEGIPKSHCKDWKEGNTCYVEDLSRPSNSRPAPSAPRPPAYNPPQNPGYNPWGGGTNNNGGGNYEDADCRAGGYVGRPRVNVYKAKSTGNFFGDSYRVRGEIEGVCLAEAGYFEAGRKRENIPVSTTRTFRRFEFEVKVRASENPEIRVYNVNGDVDYVAIDPNSLGSSGNSGGFGGW